MHWHSNQTTPSNISSLLPNHTIIQTGNPCTQTVCPTRPSLQQGHHSTWTSRTNQTTSLTKPSLESNLLQLYHLSNQIIPSIEPAVQPIHPANQISSPIKPSQSRCPSKSSLRFLSNSSHQSIPPIRSNYLSNQNNPANQTIPPTEPFFQIDRSSNLTNRPTEPIHRMKSPRKSNHSANRIGPPTNPTFQSR